MTKTVRILAIASALGALACSPAIQTMDGAPPQDSEYHIQPPDVLTVVVRTQPETLREVTVRPDGKISFDLIGDVMVRGRTVAQVQKEIAGKLKEFILHPDVSVTLKAANSRKYYVFGEVRQPGTYPLIGDVTAVDALGAAGGPTRMAALGSAMLVRPSEAGKQVYRVNLAGIMKAGEGETNYSLHPGDVLHVPPNASARIGYALQVVFFPLQQIIGLGGQAVIQGAGG
jgi:polysaccharide export outer membrane protein